MLTINNEIEHSYQVEIWFRSISLIDSKQRCSYGLCGMHFVISGAGDGGTLRGGVVVESLKLPEASICRLLPSFPDLRYTLMPLYPEF